MTHARKDAPAARRHGAAQYNALVTAWRLLIEQAGGIDAAASCTRVKRSSIAAYGAPGTESFVPADVVLDLETLLGVPLVTRALAAASGFSLVALTPRDGGDLAQAMAKVGEGVSKLFADAARALGHATPTENERRALLADLEEIAGVIADARDVLGRMNGREVPRG